MGVHIADVDVHAAYVGVHFAYVGVHVAYVGVHFTYVGVHFAYVAVAHTQCWCVQALTPYLHIYISSSLKNCNVYIKKCVYFPEELYIIFFFCHGQIAFPVSTWTRQATVKSEQDPAVLEQRGFWQMGVRGRV